MTKLSWPRKSENKIYKRKLKWNKWTLLNLGSENWSSFNQRKGEDKKGIIGEIRLKETGRKREGTHRLNLKPNLIS